MKRYGHGRYKKETATAADDEPTPAKIMKHEAEETSAVEDQQQQADVNPIPMVLSLLSQRGASLGRSLLQHQKDPLARLGADINNRTTAEPRDKLFNSQLVQEVSRHPALFDFTSEEYKSIEARNRHWDEVSTAVGQPLEFVRTRWKTLRDRFKKEVRRVQQNQPGLPWQHYEEMLYLLPFVRDKLEEIPYCGSGNFSEAIASKQQKQQQQNNGGNVGANMTSTVNGEQQQRPSPMNSCTAAILDLAMCAAMNNRFSPSSSPPLSNESLDGVEVEPYSVSSSTAAGGTAIANGSSRIRSLQSSAADQPNGQITIQSGGKLAAASWNGAENGDEEDQLFCRIVLKKLGKLEERVKDTAKAKIMEILVEMQYGIVGGTGEYAVEKNSQSN